MAQILHVTDLHAQRERYAWLAREAPRYDLICFTGDLLDECSCVPLAAQIRGVTEWLRPVSTPLAICRGNHDVGDDVRRGGEWMQALAGPSRWIDEPHFSFLGLTFVSFGWGMPLTIDLSAEVALTHAPPIGTATARVRRNGVDWGNLAWDCRLGHSMPGPRLVLCGHVHDPESWRTKLGETWIFNPGLDTSRVAPNHVVLDTERGGARWIVRGVARGQQCW